MKVLLTGASGFVGSHVLDSLRARGISVAVLLRTSSSRKRIERHLPQLEVQTGSISNPADLDHALDGITHVVHCAGCTKALRAEEFYTVNQLGTRSVVEAINRHASSVQRVIHISSLAAAGPALPESPAKEEDPPRPVSEYGRSKLAAESEVHERCKVEYVILRPPSVYGPRDTEFLRLFKAIRAHLLPKFAGGRQWLSLVYVRDLAEVAVTCLTQPATARRTYHVTSPEPLTAGTLACEIAAQLGSWTIPLPLPAATLWPIWAMTLGRNTAHCRGCGTNLDWSARLITNPAWLQRSPGIGNRAGSEQKSNHRLNLGSETHPELPLR